MNLAVDLGSVESVIVIITYWRQDRLSELEQKQQQDTPRLKLIISIDHP